MTTARTATLLTVEASHHAFEPFWSSDEPCWCGRAAAHRLHASDRPLLDTPEGDLLRSAQLEGVVTPGLRRARRRSNLLALACLLPGVTGNHQQRGRGR